MDTTLDMISDILELNFTGVLGDDYNYRVMLYDGNIGLHLVIVLIVTSSH